MRLITWVVWGLALSGCALAGEPRFSRPLPTSGDGAVVGDSTAPTDGDNPDASSPDAAPPDAAPDAGPTCIPVGMEICNGIDDDCVGGVDNVPVTPGIPCVVNVTRGAVMVPTLGEYRGCACVVAPRPAEICGNAVDDNNDGTVDEGCECDAYVVPLMLRSVLGPIAGRIGIYDTVDGALAGTATMAGHRNICLFTSLIADCGSAAAYLSSFTVPDNVSVLGGWVVNGLTVQRSLLPECRTKISGTVQFAPASGANTALSRVRVRREGNNPAIIMPANGWLSESTIEAYATDGPATAISADGPATVRFVRAVNVIAEAGEDRAAALVAARGFIDVSGAQVSARSGRDAVGVHLLQTTLARVDNVEVASLVAPQTVIGVQIERPRGASLLTDVRGGAGGAAQTAMGYFADCDVGTPVQIAGSRWSGAVATESDAILVRGCRAEISGTLQPTSYIAFNGTNDVGATRADALRCEAQASCEVLGSPMRTLSFRSTATASASFVDRTRGVVATNQSRAIVLGALIDGRGGSQASVGLEMGGSVLIASHNEIIAGGATPAEASRAVEIDQTVGALLHTNALRVHQGVGLVVMSDASAAVVVTANTISSVSSANTSNVNLVVINGARRMPVVSFENNLLACSNAATPPLSMTRGIVVGEINPFALFSYNMIAGCATPTVVGAANLMDPAVIQARFDMAHTASGALVIPRASVAIDPASGWRLTGSSPAQGIGSPSLGGATDMDGQPRSMAPMPDIGADEI